MVSQDEAELVAYQHELCEMHVNLFRTNACMADDSLDE